MATKRLIAGLTSPWSIGFSTFGAAYGIYNIIDSSQSGTKYELAEDLSGKTYVVTGATSGIGLATAEELAKRNARVIMACRNREKCVEARRDIVLATRNKQVYCRQCDMEDFDSIQAFVSKLSHGKFELDRIDGVVANAATMNTERKLNKDGIESTLATNHLGPFLLTGLLLDRLLAQPHPVRLVFVNSNVISRKVDLDVSNLNEEEEVTEEKKKKKKWDGYEVYKKTKLAEAMFAKELAEKLKDTNITVTMADPGRTKSNLTAQADAEMFFISRWMIRFVSFVMGERRVEKAVRPVLYAVADPDMNGVSGVFINRERTKQPWGDAVDDVQKRRRLWAVSEKWTRFADRLAAVHANSRGESQAVAGKSSESGQSRRSWFWFW